MKWVTWENIGVDRMACAWLIRRHIDPKAEFRFVPVEVKVFPRGTTPFDIPGTRYSHHRGHCTFHTFVREYKLKDPILKRIASIVDEADIVQDIAIEPIAPGLDFLCRGIRQVSSSDAEALERGLVLYDALYAQLKLDPR